MTLVVTLGFPKVFRGICSASCWLLMLLCAAIVAGCAAENPSAVNEKPSPTTAPADAENLAMDKAAMEFCSKSQTQADAENEIKIPVSVRNRQSFISTTPWTLLAPPHDYFDEFSQDISTPKLKSKSDTTKIVTTLIKKDTPAAEAKSAPVQAQQPVVNDKKFISTTPWTRLAPPTDYGDDSHNSRIADGEVIWKPIAKTNAKPATKKKQDKIPQKSAKPKNISAQTIKTKPQVIKKPAAKIAVVKKSPKDWTWPSSARLEGRSRNGKKFPATTPWAIAAPTTDQTARLDMAATTAKLPCMHADDKRMACELRVVRISDGRVISSASAIATCRNIDRLARALVGEFGRDGNIPIGADIAVVSLSNREGTDQGLLLSEKMTQHVISALKRASKFKFLKHLDLRDNLLKEESLESSRAITAKTISNLMQNAKYVVVGGISLQHPLPVSLPSEEESDVFSVTSYCGN